MVEGRKNFFSVDSSGVFSSCFQKKTTEKTMKTFLFLLLSISLSVRVTVEPSRNPRDVEEERAGPHGASIGDPHAFHGFVQPREEGGQGQHGEHGEHGKCNKCNVKNVATLEKFDWAAGGSFVSRGVVNTTIWGLPFVAVENQPSLIAFDFPNKRYTIQLFGGDNPLTQWGTELGTWYLINGRCLFVDNYNFDDLLSNYSTMVSVARFYSSDAEELSETFVGSVSDSGYCGNYGGISVVRTVYTKRLLVYAFTGLSGVLVYPPDGGAPIPTNFTDLPVGSIIYQNTTFKRRFSRREVRQYFTLNGACAGSVIYPYCPLYYPIYRNSTCIPASVSLVDF
jgi:hypothetical protein